MLELKVITSQTSLSAVSQPNKFIPVLFDMFDGGCVVAPSIVSNNNVKLQIKASIITVALFRLNFTTEICNDFYLAKNTQAVAYNNQ